MSSVQPKSTQHTNNRENVTHSQEKRQSTETKGKIISRLYLEDNDFKAALVSMLNDENMLKREIRTINQMNILQLKT